MSIEENKMLRCSCPYYAEEVLAYLLCNGIPFVHRKAACPGRFLLFFIIDEETKEEIEATTRWQLSSEDGFGNDEVWSAIEKP